MHHDMRTHVRTSVGNKSQCDNGIQEKAGNCHCKCQEGWVGTKCSMRQVHVVLDMQMRGINHRLFLLSMQQRLRTALGSYLNVPRDDVEIDNFADVRRDAVAPDQRRRKSEASVRAQEFVAETQKKAGMHGLLSGKEQQRQFVDDLLGVRVRVLMSTERDAIRAAQVQKYVLLVLTC